MAELVDALDLGSSSFGSAGSIPVARTIFGDKMRELMIARLLEWEDGDCNNENNQHFTFATLEEYQAMSDHDLLRIYGEACIVYGY